MRSPACRSRRFLIRRAWSRSLEGYLQSEVLEEALRAVLEDEVDVLGVVEEAVELEHVGVVHVHLQLDLPEDLILHLCLLYLGLVHHLYREDVLG